MNVLNNVDAANYADEIRTANARIAVLERAVRMALDWFEIPAREFNKTYGSMREDGMLQALSDALGGSQPPRNEDEGGWKRAPAPQWFDEPDDKEKQP